jgi:Methyltransferase domain
VVWDWPDEAGLAALYAEAWARTDGGRFATGATKPDLAGQLIGLAGKPVVGLKCLDFGAGRGELARELLSEGAECVAVEPFGPDPAIAALRWLPSLAEARQFGPYDLIYAIEVIEHHPEPGQCLRDLARQMSAGSRLVITTPNALGLNSLLRARHWREVNNLTHLCLFSPYGLRACAERSGLVFKSRATAPIRFGNSGLRWRIQAVLQRLKIDGSLRMVLGAGHSESGS